MAADFSSAALILTSSTYDGMCYDLKPIIQAAHAHGIKVIIDEAWYGFARFHPAFRPTALELGADYVTQSTHKTMSAFSQASMVHVNDQSINDEPHVMFGGVKCSGIGRFNGAWVADKFTRERWISVQAKPRQWPF